MVTGFILLAALAASGFTYFRLEAAPEGSRQRRLVLPFVLRSLAWFCLGLLLADLSCGARRGGTPLVLLDASLSMTADSAHWRAAQDTARHLGEVERFGDPGAPHDSTSRFGISRLLPALRSAAAGDRPVTVVTDGEIQDAADLPPDLLHRATIRVLPRPGGPDLAVTLVEGPDRIVAGDSARLLIRLRSFSDSAARDLPLVVREGQRELARRVVTLAPQSSREERVTVPAAALHAGTHLLDVALQTDDREPRDDARLFLLTVTPTPGVVLVANPPDWDTRFLYRALEEVARLPVRGYIQLRPDRWRSMRDLSPVPRAVVERAARSADLLVLKGQTSAFARATRARGVLEWRDETGQGSPVAADWYVTLPPGSPLAASLAGLPLDSFPPLSQLVPVVPRDDQWIGLSAQQGRRGAARPVLLGSARGGRREIQLLGEGFYRWDFQGGASEQGYRSLFSAAVTWLLGGRDTVAGAAQPVRAVVAAGRPVLFQWNGAGPAEPLAVVWDGPGGVRQDSLRFDGAGRAEAWLSSGIYHYRLPAGGAGTVAVERWSEEYLPHPRTLQSASASLSPLKGGEPLRSIPWLFGACAAAFCGEWVARRRLGLR